MKFLAASIALLAAAGSALAIPLADSNVAQSINDHVVYARQRRTNGNAIRMHKRTLNRNRPIIRRRKACSSGDNGDSGSGSGSSASPSKTKSASASDPTSTGKSSGGGNAPSSGASSALFPLSINGATSSWTTMADLSGVKSEPLSDATLNIYSGKGTHHKYTKAPDGTMALQALYQAGGSAPGHSGSKIVGFSLYSKGPVPLSSGKEIVFSYRAYFPKGHDFVKGGKLPGLYGGTNDKIATTCSGGRHGGGDCFSARLMWREGGKGELYSYLPQTSANTKAYQSAAKTHINGDYGISVGTGSFMWNTGVWTTVSERVLLNDPGKNNGAITIYVNGKKTIDVPGLLYRTSKDSLVRGMQIQTFYGGHDTSWAPKSDQYSYFKDFSAAILQ